VTATTDKIAVIKTQLPYIDRRSLSEAWFNAFHLAGGAAPSAPAHPVRPQPPAHATPSALAARRDEPAAAAQASGSRPAYTRRSSDVRAQEPATPSARRRARLAAQEPVAVPPAKTSPVQATFTLTVEDARVAIHVRHEDGKLRVIALCSERHVEIVQRVLAKTALAMRARGASIDTLVQSSDTQVRP
jgi:pyruvate/2-oxoglutarate dehydrogenase complex dihydrolipoamide acyltransferase (E2) component